MLLSASCSNEELFNETEGLYTLQGTVEDYAPVSRVGFDKNNAWSFFWNNGDEIAVGAASLTKFTTNCTDKATSADFTASGSTPSGYAIYPWSGAKAISGTTLTYEFKKEYTYSTVDTDFFSGMSVDMPMWAKVVGNTLSFKHLGGIFAFKVPNLKAGDNQTFTLTADQKIAGTFTADLSVETPQFETSSTTTDEEKKVTINFSLTQDADAVFYVPVPVGTYEIKVEIKNGENSYSNEYKNLQIARRAIAYTTMTSHTLQGGEAKVVESASDVSNAMETSTNVIVSAVASTAANSIVSITLPKKSGNTDDTHTLSFGSIDGNTQTIAINESETGVGNSISKLEIHVPTTEDAKKLEVNMPNTTVTIVVNGMTALTLDEVTASTAENTLVVGKGVVINKLNVVKGNVKVYGKVSSILRPESNTDSFTFIIKGDDNAVIPTGLGNKFKVVSAAEYELISKFKQGGTQTITMTQDVELTEPLTLTEGTVTLNMNGHKLTAPKSDAIVVTGENTQLTITGNGTVQVLKGANGCAVWAHHGGKVIIENGTFSTNDDADGNRCDCIYAGSSKDSSAGTIIINGGTFKYDGDSAEGHKYLLNLKDNTTSDIIVKGGKFYNFNPSNNAAENPSKNFVASGYVSEVDGDYYVVSRLEAWDGQKKVTPTKVDDVYQIAQPAEWAWYVENGRGATFAIIKDLDFGNHSVYNLTNGKGVLDFGNHAFINMVLVPHPTQSDYSLGLISGDCATEVTGVKNLRLENIRLVSTDKTNSNNNLEGYAGVVFGDVQRDMTIENVTVSGCNIKGIQSVGGLVGYLNGKATLTIKNCTVTGCTLTNFDEADESGYVAALVGRPCGNVVAEGTVNVTDNVVNATYATREGRGEASIQAVLGGVSDLSSYTNIKSSNNKVTRIKQIIADLKISTVSELQAFAKDYAKYEGKVVALMNDLDLKDVAWEPIGACGSCANAPFKGTFDGCGHTIKNLTVNEKTGIDIYDGVAFFGWLNGTLKNLNFRNATVKGHHNVAVAVGYLEGGAIENCSIETAEVEATKLNNDRDGDKAGVLVGYVNAGVVKNCAVKGSIVKAGRDAGQVIGCCIDENVRNGFTGITVENVTVSSNNTSTGANINNAIVGRTTK